MPYQIRLNVATQPVQATTAARSRSRESRLAPPPDRALCIASDGATVGSSELSAVEIAIADCVATCSPKLIQANDVPKQTAFMAALRISVQPHPKFDAPHQPTR